MDCGLWTILCFLLLFLAQQSHAQIGGRNTFEFLNVPNNARLAALGGVNVSLADRDVNFFFSNPALVSDTLSGFASAGYQFYVADVGQATFTYAHDFKKLGTLTFGIQHLNYGSIKGYDATGASIGDYKSGETALVIGKSHQISNFRIGANFKMAFSNLAGYRANAMMLDIGGVFVHPKKDLRVGLTIKNLGFVLSDYSNSSDAKLPFDVQLGVTFKPEHMPLRFSFTGYNLASSNVTYYNAVAGDEEPGTLDKILRRINIGAEILLHKNVNVLVGYNYLIHQELKLENAGGSAGLSFGFSARIKAVEFVFSRSAYVIGNAAYNFTLATDVNRFLRKK
ncbi:MAG TPA: type IX secretion system protein PorQ [Chryseolinea sp.]|nr:type IX secretion system protein PorQ [Chryseolinea sp.]